MYRRVRRVVAATYRGKFQTFLNSAISCVVAIFLSATDNSTYDSEPPAAARQHCPPPQALELPGYDCRSALQLA